MKFPVNIEKYISDEERLSGEELSQGARDLCKKFLKAANRVYRDALNKKISSNPFDRDPATEMRRLWKEHNMEEPSDSEAIFEVLTVLRDWCSDAYEQGIQDRGAKITT